MCLLGANGAGKSTTINMLLNFIQPTSGSAMVNNLDVLKNPLKTKEFLTYIPENLMLYPTFSALENLDYFTKLSGKKFNSKKLEMILSEAGLEQQAHTKNIKTFSKGMRQKVGIALAIAKESKVLLLDEPTSGLDPVTGSVIDELIVKSVKRLGASAITITHDMASVSRIADKVILIDDQTVSWTGKPNEMLKSNNAKVQQFIKALNPKLFK